ncbi:MAG TPA: PAS domain S-box protein [Terracidiphilus sp.]|nr:PAS domain S-box protein [Terracidiphilus sp.]
MRKLEKRPEESHSAHSSMKDAPVTEGVKREALRAAVIGGLVMLGFECVKMDLIPQIHMWASHLLTIVFSALMAGGTGYLVLERQGLMRRSSQAIEERYRLLFERSAAGAYLATREGKILDCNLSFCRMLGYSAREEIIGASLDRFYASRADVGIFLSYVRKGEALDNEENCLVRKDGSAIWVIHSAVLADGEQMKDAIIRGTLTDITERREAERKEQSLAAIVRCSSYAMISLDRNGIIESWNRGAENLFGYTPEEVLGRSVGILSSADSEHFKEAMETVKREGSVLEVEATRARKDGKLIDVTLSLSPITNTSKECIGFAGILRDIGDRKRAEQALRVSEMQYRLLFEGNPVPMWIHDPETLCLLAVNEAAVRQYGYAEAELLSMTVSQIRSIRASDPEQAADPSVRNQELHAELHCTKDGSLLDVEAISHDLPFRGKNAVLVAASDVTERTRAKKLIEEREKMYRALFEDSPDAYWLMDEKGHLDCNAAALKMFGYSKKTDVTNPADISPPLQPDGTPSSIAVGKKIMAAIQNGAERFEWLHQRKNGEVFYADVSLAELKLNDRQSLLACVRDISERKKSEAALEFKTALLEAQSETTIDGILVVDETGRIVLSNRQFIAQFGLPLEMINALEDYPVLHHVMNLVVDADTFIQRVKYLYRHRYEKGMDELQLKDGRTFDRYSAPLIDSKGLYRGRIWYFRDITDRKAAEARIQHQAFYDTLTDLPNRALLKDRLAMALANGRRGGRKVAVLFLDLDHFKLINDSLGHSLGDFLLKDVAERLKTCVRDQDTVARVGGDEFVIALSSLEDITDATLTAARIVEALGKRFEVEGHSLSTSCSVGISLFPDHGTDGETLIKYADQAMSKAKSNGRNGFHLYSEDLNRRAVAQLNLDNALHRALERKEFYVVYQPQMEIATRRITGFEALIRWKHSKLGLVPPNEFIPIAERNGLILPIGEWVLRSVCAQAAKWYKDGLLDVPVAVNVSAVQFRQQGFCELIKAVLLETGLPPQYLELELTESLLLSNADVMFSVLQRVRELGVKLSIDDFGTGYSSLSYLKHFRVNKLKIDRSFIQDISTNFDDRAIATAIIGMAKSLNLLVIAEGVEDEVQISILRELQCEQIQGYYFSKPLSASETSTLLRHNRAQGVWDGRGHSVMANSQNRPTESSVDDVCELDSSLETPEERSWDLPLKSQSIQ